MASTARTITTSVLLIAAFGLLMGALFMPWFSQTSSIEECSGTPQTCEGFSSKFLYGLTDVEIRNTGTFGGESETYTVTAEYAEAEGELTGVKGDVDKIEASHALTLAAVVALGLVIVYAASPQVVGRRGLAGVLGGIAVLALLGGIIFMSLGTTGFADEVKKDEISEAGDDATVTGARPSFGLFMAGAAWITALAGVLLVLTERAPASAGDAAPAGASAQVRHLACPRCKSMVTVRGNQRPSCLSCGFTSAA